MKEISKLILIQSVLVALFYLTIAENKQWAENLTVAACGYRLFCATVYMMALFAGGSVLRDMKTSKMEFRRAQILLGAWAVVFVVVSWWGCAIICAFSSVVFGTWVERSKYINEAD